MFNAKLKKFALVPILAIASVLSIVIPLSGCTNKAEEPKSFTFDSWYTISKVAEGGLDKLIEVYKPVGGTFIIQDFDDETETAAKTRKINIEGVGEFGVRVIAENHDVQQNDKTAALTFEFNEIVPNVPFAKANVVSNNWENSEIRYYLNNNLLNMFPADLQRSIKTVKKDTCIGGSDEVKTTTEKVFPLSVSEINALGISNVSEGEAYKLYSDYPYTPGDDDDPRVKDDKSYWLRSPMSQNSVNVYLIRVGKSEGFYNQVCFDDATESKGVIPCFCI